MRCRAKSLASAEIGCDWRISAVQAAETEHTQRLRELGLLEGRTVRLLTNRDPLICQVGSCRLGLCRRLARCIQVEPAAAG